MSNAVTIRNDKLRDKKLRLVSKGNQLYDLANGKICTNGSDADDVLAQQPNLAEELSPTKLLLNLIIR